jgi:hypothetical protein
MTDEAPMTTTMREGDPECNEEAISAIAALLREEVERRFALEGDYAERERVMHEVGNEVLRLVQAQDLQTIADRFDTAEVVYAGHVYRRHEEASPTYHGLSGPVMVRRWTYRQAGVHNGPTIVPLDLAAGLIERATPATASAFLTGEADTHSRELREHLLSSLRVPPSRTTIERVVHRAATKLREQLPLIEPVLRIAERVPEGAVAMSMGLDRTSVPMEEKLAPEEVPERRRKKRKKPYERKPPEPVEVNYRMAYVGTVSFLDVDGRPLRTLRYFASAGTGPKTLVESMMRDIRHARREKPELPLCVVQDAAPEMWNLVRAGLKKHELVADAELVDRYHLDEHLMTALRAGGYTPAWCEQKLHEWNRKLNEDDGAIDEIDAWVCEHRWKMGGEACEALIDEVTYLENNKDRMRYASARARGLPCGSGATEGACKSVVKVRACRSGQRWHAEGVDNILTLRALSQGERLPGAIEILRRDRYAAEVRPAA